MRLGYRHIELWRRLIQTTRCIFYHHAFLACVKVLACSFRVSRSGALRKYLQTQISTDPVLKMDNIIACFQIREVDVQRRPCCLSMRRLEAARSLDLITAEDLRVSDNYQLRLLAKKTTREHP